MNIIEHINTILKDIFKHIGVSPEVKVEEADSEKKVYSVEITGNNLNYLIGFRGYSLDALESMLGLMLFKKLGNPVTITVDINGYKSEKIDRIHDLVKRLIDKVRFFERDVEMPPMEPWERRQVHMFISDYDDVLSESTGEGRNRRVVLKPKKNKV